MNQSTGRKTLLLTGAAGQLGTSIIELVGDQLDIIALTHRTKLRSGAADSSIFEVDTCAHNTQPIRNLNCDLASQNEIVATIKTLSELGVTVNYVIGAAGDGRFLGPTTDAMMLANDARQQFELHVFAPAIICSALFHFQWKNTPVEQQHVSILHISSMAGVEVFKDTGQGLYAASKAAINMLTMHMAAEYGRYGIKVNALAPNSFPGIVDTGVVASNALRILTLDATGQLFKIG